MAQIHSFKRPYKNITAPGFIGLCLKTCNRKACSGKLEDVATAARYDQPLQRIPRRGF